MRCHRARMGVVIGCCLIAAMRAGAADVTATWNGTTGNWSTATRWSSNPLVPNNGNGGFTYDASASSGTITVDIPVTINTLTLTGGTVQGASTLNLTGLQWSGGTIRGSGQINLTAGGSSSITGASTKTLSSGKTLNNNGSMTWLGGGAINATNSNVIFNNNAGALFDIKNNSDFTLSAGGSNYVINNTGTFRKSGGTGISFVDWDLNNTGSVSVQVGTLVLEGLNTVTHTGNFSVSSGADLTFFAGVQNLNSGASINNSGTVEFTGGTVSVNQDMSVGGIVKQDRDGIIAGNNTLTVSNFTWGSGTQQGTGQTVIAVGGVMNLVTGIGAGRNLNGGRTLTNNGTVNALSGGLLANSNTTVTNSAGATWNDQSFTFNNILSSSGVFTNTGVYNKIAPGSTSTFETAWAFNSTGILNGIAGTLALKGGGTLSGPVQIASGAKIQFAGGTFNFSSGSQVNGGGTAEFGGTVNFSASLNMDPASGGVLISGGTFNLNSGANPASFGTALTIQSNGKLKHFQDLTLSVPLIFSGAIDSANSLTVKNLTWTGGGKFQNSGNLVVDTDGAAQLSTQATLFLASGRTFTNKGSVVHSSGDVGTAGSNITVNNLSGATWEMQNSSGFTVNDIGSNYVFNNAGLLLKNGATSSLSSFWVLNNSGTVNVNGGDLFLACSGSSSGSWIVASGARLELSGAFNLNSGTSISNSGTIQFANTTLNADLNVGGTLSAVNISGSGNLTLNNLSWNSGVMSGTGATTVNGTTTISGNDSRTLSSGRTFNNNGSLTWSGSLNADILATGSTVTFNNGSGAIFDAQGNRSFLVTNAAGSSNLNTFNNAGLFRKTVGTGTISFQSGWSLNNTGTVQIQTGTLSFASGAGLTNTGTITLNSGTTLSGTGTFTNSAGGKISGLGTIAAGVNNLGTVAAGPGQLKITGAYLQTAAAHMGVELGGYLGAGQGQLAVTGAATLAGTLDLSVVNNFHPAYNDAFSILTAASRTGTFSAINGLTINADLFFTVNYTPTSVVLLVKASRGDFDSDGDVDAADVDAIYAHLGGNAAYDLNGDSIVTAGDADYLLNNILHRRRGDVDLDGDVDTTDLSAIRGHLGQLNGGWASGDFDGDGDVDASDLSVFRTNLGLGIPGIDPGGVSLLNSGSFSLVPEPAFVLPAILAAGAGIRLRKRMTPGSSDFAGVRA